VAIAVVGIITFLRRRRRRSRPRSILTFSTDFMEDGPEPIVSPFDPFYYETMRDSGIVAEQQPLVTEEAEADMVALHHLSSTPPTRLPLLQSRASVPVGLSEKEIVRLREEGFNSQQTHNLGVSTSDVSQSMSFPNAVTDSREAPYDPQRLHSEVESLVWREMERLHAEGLAVEAPPSYTEGDG
jgi:hypothetical protein